MESYLDHAATAGMSDVALAAYTHAAQVLGNPSSLHSAGRAARRIVEDARESIAANLGAHPSEVVFTSGGTESNNLAVKGIFWAQVAKHPNHNRVITSPVEHHSVIGAARWLARHGAKLDLAPVDHCGIVPPEELANLLKRSGSAIERPPGVPGGVEIREPFSGNSLNADAGNRVALISIMLANNEIGTIEPIAELSEIARSTGVPIHSDAVAAMGQVPISFADLGVDALSVAAHKIGGPLGVGALLLKRGVPIEPLHHGGDQERSLRAGTINVPGVAGFAAALQQATDHLETYATQVAQLRDQLIVGVLAQVPNAELTGANPSDGNRLPANASFVFPGCDPDALLFGLDNAGFQASIGAACAAGVAQPSETLLACGFPDAVARSSLRFTLGANTTPQEIERLIKILPGIVSAARFE